MYGPKQKRIFEKGQSLVEFTMTLVVLLIIVSGILDLGRIYYIIVALEDGAGEAALYLSLNPSCLDNTSTSIYGNCADPNNAEYRARHSGTGGGMVDWTDVDNVVIEMTTPDNLAIDLDEPVSVTIKYQFQPITPIITRLAKGRITLTVHAAQPIVAVNQLYK